ncbi:MAG: flagellar motor protein MotB [Thermodesulfobacteriota bacterium]|nr:flagellar motor protein MotB [Thermodesulfobacteriota bacterium]
MIENRGYLKLSKSERSSESGGWEITYTGFVLILLCFFIMLSSFASMESGKVARFVASFVDAVSVLSGGIKFESGGTILDHSEDIVEKESEIAKLLSDIQEVAGRLGIGKDVEVSLEKRGLVIRFANTIMFDIGEAAIIEGAIPMLSSLASIISDTSHSIRIEGHTDNLPINTKRYSSNWELSAARAVNVLRYFIEQGEIPAERLSAVGFGEYHPVFPNDSTEHREKNRRVEIFLVEQDHEEAPKEMLN